jgi:hypothetical protein
MCEDDREIRYLRIEECLLKCIQGFDVGGGNAERTLRKSMICRTQGVRLVRLPRRKRLSLDGDNRMDMPARWI